VKTLITSECSVHNLNKNFGKKRNLEQKQKGENWRKMKMSVENQKLDGKSSRRSRKL